MSAWFRRTTPEEELPLSRNLPLNEDVGRELALHLEQREQELIAEGWAPDSARAEARRLFGDLGRVEAECRGITRRHRRATRRAETLDTYRQDLVLAARLLRKSPGFTAAAVLTLALGIGANTAIFSVVNATLLRPLPYDHPNQLMDIAEAHARGWGNPPWRNMLDWRAESRSFDGMASYGRWFRTILTPNGPVSGATSVVSEDFFKVLRVSAVRGRLPVPDEHRVGAPPVAVVSWRFWNARLDARPDLTDQRLRMDRDYQVIGVLPPGFGFPDDADVWVPLELGGPSDSRTAHNWSVVARLRPGVTARAAERELDTLTAHMKELYSPDFDATGAIVRPLQDLLTGPLARPLFLLLGAAGLLLLAACINLATTMLARGTARQQELAVRVAIGAGRLRLVRQLFTESLLLALLGCVAGVVVAELLLRVFVHLAPAGLGLERVTLDGWVLAFTGLVGLTTAVLIGLLPALRTSGADPGLALREGIRAGTGLGRGRIWSALVVAEVALAVTLLCGSGVLIRSFARVLAVNPGFDPDSVLTAALSLPTADYDDDAKLERLYTRLLESLRAVPGVRSAAVTSAIPLGGNNSSGSFGIEGVPPGPAGYGPGGAGYRMVSEDYFATMGIPILAGRDFDRRDAAGAPGTVIVNQAVVDQWFHDADPIGRRIRLQSGMDNQGDGWLTIVGVVGNVHHRSLTAPPDPETYVPLHQRPTRGYSTVIVLRSGTSPEALEAPVRAVLAREAPDVVPAFATMTARLTGSVADRRFTMLMLSAFALVALLLAGVGIFGVVSYTAARRTREMGIRMALGADPAVVRGLVQQGAMTQVLLGLVAGSLLALAATQLMGSLLFDVGTADPAAFGAAVALLAVVGWLASWVPARRVAGLDPTLAIRAE
jgi:putative ABC transport system permease protein